MVRYNKSQGLKKLRGEEVATIELSHFSFSQLNTYLYDICDVTKMHCTHEFRMRS